MWIDVVVDVIVITVMTIDTVTGVSQRPTAATVNVKAPCSSRNPLKKLLIAAKIRSVLESSLILITQRQTSLRSDSSKSHKSIRLLVLDLRLQLLHSCSLYPVRGSITNYL